MFIFSTLLLPCYLVILKIGEGANRPHALLQDNITSLSKETGIAVGGTLFHRPPFSTDTEHQWVRNFVHSTASYSLFSGYCRNCTDIDICIHELSHVTGHRQTHSQTLCTDSHPVSALCEHLTDTRNTGVQTCLFSLYKVMEM